MRGLLLRDLLQSILQPGRRRPEAGRAQPFGDLARLSHELLGARGEVSGVGLGRSILATYGRLPPEERLAFFHNLAEDFELDPTACLAAARALEAERSPATLAAMRAAAEPPRQELLRRLNLAPGGTEALVRMREHLLDLLPDHPSLASVDDDFVHLFASWFNRGFLVLKRMDWTSPAALLEKIIAYEAVHEIAGWPELRRRVEPPDRLCYAFFHPAMPGEPLIVIEVALTRGIPGRIDTLLEEDRPVLPAGDATAACFYSISNCQRGLRGVSFGNDLIKQVAGELAAAHPGLRTFVTLSPMPGFANWARGAGHAPPSDDPGPDEQRRLERLALHYLMRETRGDGLPRDAVARFHLGNGARLEAVRWAADQSARGLARSFGMMVNYLYDLDAVERNHEAYRESGHVPASPAVEALVREVSSQKAVPWPIRSTTHSSSRIAKAQNRS